MWVFLQNRNAKVNSLDRNVFPILKLYNTKIQIPILWVLLGLIFVVFVKCEVFSKPDQACRDSMLILKNLWQMCADTFEILLKRNPAIPA